MDRKVFTSGSIILIIVLLIALVASIGILYSQTSSFVVKVNGQGMPADEFKEYLKIVKKEKEKLAGVTTAEQIKKFWTEPVEGTDPMVFARQETVDSTINLMIIAQKAKEMNAISSEMELALLKEKLKEQGFFDEMKDLGISDEYIEKFVNNWSQRIKLYNMLTTDISITEKQLDDVITKDPELIKQYNVRHILFSTRDQAWQEISSEEEQKVRQRAEGVLKRIQAGEDFSKLAGEYTDDPGSKTTGGKFSFYKGEAVAEFQDSAMKLKPGEVSGLVKTYYGYHIIKLETIVVAQGEELERARQRIRDTYNEQQRNEYFEAKMKEWRAQAKIEKNEKILNSINLLNIK